MIYKVIFFLVNYVQNLLQIRDVKYLTYLYTKLLNKIKFKILVNDEVLTQLLQLHL